MTPLEIRAETATLRRRLEVIQGDAARMAKRISGQLRRLDEAGETLDDFWLGERLDQIKMELRRWEGRG